jgi:schlafen family protein
MIDKPIGEISVEDVEGLRINGVPESRTLEYKRELPGGTDSDRKEFLADVSSFANAVGGDLVYGVKRAKTESLAAWRNGFTGSGAFQIPTRQGGDWRACFETELRLAWRVCSCGGYLGLPTARS